MKEHYTGNNKGLINAGDRKCSPRNYQLKVVKSQKYYIFQDNSTYYSTPLFWGLRKSHQA